MAKENTITQKRKPLIILNLINAMTTYIRNDNHNFYRDLELVYCQKCETVLRAGGDYNFQNEIHNQKKHCLECKSTDFIVLDSIYALQKIKPKELFSAIQKGLEKMNFPDLHSEELPIYANAWKRLSKEDKLKQILESSKLHKQIEQIYMPEM